MNLYSQYLCVFDNKLLKYLYSYDTEILYENGKLRAALILYVDGIKYAIPFRSNMLHLEGKVFTNKISKYGLDFTKAIPVFIDELLKKQQFLLKRVEQEYYSQDENYIMINLKFEQYLKKIYYAKKYHTTNHELLAYAQKYYLLLKNAKFLIYNHHQEQVLNFLDIIDYPTIFPVLDQFYQQLELFTQSLTYQTQIITELTNSNQHIMIIRAEQ